MASYCNFGIYGEKLEFHQINKRLSLNPTEMFYKGECFDGQIAEEDRWLLDINFNENENPNAVLRDLLNKLISNKDFLNNAGFKYIIMWLDLYFDSYKANIVLTKTVINQLLDIGATLQVDFVRKISVLYCRKRKTFQGFRPGIGYCSKGKK